MHSKKVDRGSIDAKMKETWGKLLGVLAKTNSYRADPIRREITFIVAMLIVAAEEWEGKDRMPPYERGSMLRAHIIAKGSDADTADPADAVFMDIEDVLSVIDEKLVTQEHDVELVLRERLT